MSLLPRSLFRRNLLLIVSLIVLSQLMNALVYREFVIRPRVLMSASTTARNLAAAAAGLRALPPSERAGFVQAFNSHFLQHPPEPVHEAALFAARAPSRRLLPLEQEFVDHLSRELSLDGGRLTWHREATGTLALSIDLNGDGVWIDMPGLVPGRQYSGSWLAASISAALLALYGAWLIQRRINRPLQAVMAAAQTLARGDKPPVLPEDGPTEIATVARGFNEMVHALAQQGNERMLMLAGLSHDLRTPLAKLRLAAQMLDGQGDVELLASLHRNVESLDELLDQFLTYTRVSGSGWEMEPLVDTDLNALIDDVLALQPRLADSPPLQRSGPPLPRLPLRTQAVQRLVQNLVTNAQRHGAPPIEVATDVTAESVALEVRDRGPGIDPAQADSLKAPFIRGEAARGGASGAGLGLAIVDRIARAHGANFALMPRPGGGLIARVTWPRH